MKICVIQQPYPHTPEEAPAAVDFLIRELESCDPSMDLIVTPEYSNTPAAFPEGENIPFAEAHTAGLIRAATGAARRCHAVVALSFCAETRPGVWHNVTRVYRPDGTEAGEYWKQQLTEREPKSRQLDNGYTLEYRPPAIVEAGGIRFGFVTCYDSYFEEYIAHLAYRKPDVVLVCSHQRGERQDILEMLNRSLAFHVNAYVVRASVGMGEGARQGGCSLVADPSGRILANAYSRNGKLLCEVENIHWKYMRSDSFGGPLIANDRFIEKGRTPWSYRAAGSAVCPGEKRKPYPRVCAHRGFLTIAPENSLPAFGAAIALGADEIEFDLRPTREGVPVVIHDPTLDRVSDGCGCVAEKTLADLKTLDFGSLYGAAFAGLRIATLDDVLKKFTCQTIFNIHIKTPGDPEGTFLRRIVETIRLYDCLNHVYITGQEVVLDRMQNIAPEIPGCLLPDSDLAADDLIARALSLKCAKIRFAGPRTDREIIRRAHDNGLRCVVSRTDDPAEALRYREDGIDTILTGDFHRVSQALG